MPLCHVLVRKQVVKWPWGKRSQKLGANKEIGKKNKKEEGNVKKTDKRGRG